MFYKNFLFFIKSILLLVTLNSCMNVGQNFPSQTNWLIKNKTTQNDVLMVLGKPYKENFSKGLLVWTYAYYDYKVWQSPYQKELKINWKQDNRLESFHFYSNFPRDITKYSKIEKKQLRLGDNKKGA